AQVAGGRVLGGTRDRTALALRTGILALAGGGITRAFPDGVLALGTAHAGLEDVVVDQRPAIFADRQAVGDGVAGLEVADLLLHEHAALQRGPGHLVLLGGGAVLGVEGVRRPVAGVDVGVHSPYH